MMLSEERREWKAPSIFVGGTPFTAKSGKYRDCTTKSIDYSFSTLNGTYSMNNRYHLPSTLTVYMHSGRLRATCH